jgi:uncharacterized protein YaeQ
MLRCFYRNPLTTRCKGYPNNESFKTRLKAHFEYPDLQLKLSKVVAHDDEPLLEKELKQAFFLLLLPYKKE